MRSTAARCLAPVVLTVDAMLPDASRLHVVIPGITPKYWSVNIRKFVLFAGSLDELVGLGTLTSQAARFLEAAVVAGLNIIVAGGTQTGKTTLLNCLAGAIPGRERVVTCEEVFELAEAGLHQSAGRRRAPCAGRASDRATALPSQPAVIVRHNDVGEWLRGQLADWRSSRRGAPVRRRRDGTPGRQNRWTGDPAERVADQMLHDRVVGRQIVLDRVGGAQRLDDDVGDGVRSHRTVTLLVSGGNKLVLRAGPAHASGCGPGSPRSWRRWGRRDGPVRGAPGAPRRCPGPCRRRAARTHAAWLIGQLNKAPPAIPP